MAYTIYYGTLPNGRDKIGVDESWPNRAIQQSLTDYYVLETHDDEMVASKRELVLQKEHGLKVDQFPYHLRKVSGSRGGINNHHPNSRSWNGRPSEIAYIGINSRKENGQYQSEEWKEFCRQKSNKTKTCPHCGVTQKVMTYGRWHGDNCKQKKGL